MFVVQFKHNSEISMRDEAEFQTREEALRHVYKDMANSICKANSYRIVEVKDDWMRPIEPPKVIKVDGESNLNNWIYTFQNSDESKFTVLIPRDIHDYEDRDYCLNFDY